MPRACRWVERGEGQWRLGVEEVMCGQAHAVRLEEF